MGGSLGAEGAGKAPCCARLASRCGCWIQPPAPALNAEGVEGTEEQHAACPPRAPSSLLASPLHWPQLPPPSRSQHPPSRSAPATAPLLSQVSSASPPSRTHRFTDSAARAFTQQDTPFLEVSKRRNRTTFLVLLHLYYLLEDLRSKASVWPRKQSIRSLSHQSLSYPVPCPQGKASRQATGPCSPPPAPGSQAVLSAVSRSSLSRGACKTSGKGIHR